MLFHEMGIISIINYFCKLVTDVLNEVLLNFKINMLIINCFVSVTKKQTLPHIRKLYPICGHGLVLK